MTWLVTGLLLILGLALIVKGGDLFVDAATWIAEKTGIPKFIIGATVVSLATTLPEMMVSFFAAAEGKVDMAIGNAVGSVTANTGLVLGIAVICMPTIIKRKDYAIRATLLMVSVAVLMLAGFTGELATFASLILLALFILTMVDNVRVARKDIDEQATQKLEKAKTPRNEKIKYALMFVCGTAGIVIGAQLLIDNGSTLATLMGVPERIIAISIIAIGTSLPELVTTITAIVKKQSALSFGNIIGANIIDITLILPICALISGQSLPIGQQSARIDIPVCLAIAVLALVPSLITKKFTRLQGVLLVASYAVYMVFSAVTM